MKFVCERKTSKFKFGLHSNAIRSLRHHLHILAHIDCCENPHPPTRQAGISIRTSYSHSLFPIHINQGFNTAIILLHVLFRGLGRPFSSSGLPIIGKAFSTTSVLQAAKKAKSKGTKKAAVNSKSKKNQMTGPQKEITIAVEGCVSWWPSFHLQTAY